MPERRDADNLLSTEFDNFETVLCLCVLKPAFAQPAVLLEIGKRLLILIHECSRVDPSRNCRQDLGYFDNKLGIGMILQNIWIFAQPGDLLKTGN